jgi:ribosomal protein L29
MATKLTIKELRKMSEEDLLREIMAKRAIIGKLHMGVTIQNEKNTARYRQERKELARMLTVLNEKRLTSTLSPNL